MARTYVTTNIDQPNEDWRKVKWWYRIVSFIAAFFATITAMAERSPEFNEVYFHTVFWLALFIGYKAGVKGGCIGNRIRLALHPKSIRMYNPTTDDLIQTKLHWLFHHTLNGIILGAGAGSMLTVMFLSLFFA